MNLPTDHCRCLGAYDGRVCDRTERCARHVALRTDPKQHYVNCAALLCYSSYSFFIGLRPASESPEPAPYPEPQNRVYSVCPHCKRLLDSVVSLTRGVCADHGEVPLMRSAVVNRAAEWPDWSAA